MARVAGRALPRARPDRTSHRPVRALRPVGHGRVEPRPGGLPPHLRVLQLPRPRYHASAGDPPPAGVDRRRPQLLRRVLQVGHDAGDALAPGALLGAGRPRSRAVRRRHRPRFRAGGARRGTRLPCRLSRRADHRGSLLGPLRLRARRGGLDRRRPRPHSQPGRGDGPELPRGTGQSRSPARPPLRERLERRARQDLHREHARRIRPVGGAVDRRIDGQGGQGAHPRAGRIAGATRPAARRGADRRPLRPWRRVLPLGVRHGGRRLDPRDQRLQPAGRAVCQGPDERDPRRAAPIRTSSRRARWTTC